MTPQTAAGREFLRAIVRPFLTNNAIETRNRLDAATAAIAAIEAEARAAALDEALAVVQALPYPRSRSAVLQVLREVRG